MRCPFRYRPTNRRYSFGVAGDFLDFIEEREREAAEDYERKYTTCWAKFLHWIGWY